MHDWQRLLGAGFPAWSGLLQRIDEPAGLRFSADFGAGEDEFELTRDADGFVAIPTEGVTPHRLNVTEAEFARFDLPRVLRQLRDAAGCVGDIESLATGVYRLGERTVATKQVVLLAAPRGIRQLSGRERARVTSRQPREYAKLLLVPDLPSVLSSQVEELTAGRVALSELGEAPPLRVDWSPLADDRFDIPLGDPGFFFGARHAVIVDPQQQRIWLEGRELKVKADGHSYRLLAHLAENAGMVVPTKELANKVLEAESDRSEAKIVSDAKSELMKAIRTCLTPAPASSRLHAASLIVIEDGRARLNIDAALVKVIRRLSVR